MSCTKISLRPYSIITSAPIIQRSNSNPLNNLRQANNTRLVGNFCSGALVYIRKSDYTNSESIIVIDLQEQQYEFSTSSEIYKVKICESSLLVIQSETVTVLDEKLEVITQVSTGENYGLGDFSHGTLCTPDRTLGGVQIKQIDCPRQSLAISAHNSQLSALTLDSTGQTLATASANGTLIRIFETQTGKCIKELRIGYTKVNVSSLAFSPSSKWLAACTEEGIVYVFNLEKRRGIGSLFGDYLHSYQIGMSADLKFASETVLKAMSWDEWEFDVTEDGLVRKSEGWVML